MRKFWHWIRPRPRATVARGLLIPYTPPEITPRPTTALALRPVTALVVVSALVLFVYSEAADFTNARLTQPASPVLVATAVDPYQQQVLEAGVNSAFQDRTYAQQIVDSLQASAATVAFVDGNTEILTVYQAGQPVVTAPIRAVANQDSWRHVQAGYFTVSEVHPERYSSLEQVYYKHAVLLSSRVAIHGESVSNDGSLVDAPTIGIQLGSADAAAVAALLPPGTPVVVHTPVQGTADAEALQYRGPDLPVRSYLAAELSGSAPLMAYNTETVVPVASLTKLMTALVVAAEYDLEGEVQIDQEQYVTTLVPRLPGTSQTSVYDLLQLLLLESSNEAAEVLATGIGRDEFIVRMNEYATEIGLRDTVFTDPSGLDAGNVSTAEDILLLTQYLYQQYPFILTLTAKEGAVAAARVNDFADLENFNTIEGLDTFAGGKIGETEAAQQTSVTVHTMQFGDIERPIVIIVLGSTQRSADVRRLHQELEERFEQ